jgi:hypothetical protein
MNKSVHLADLRGDQGVGIRARPKNSSSHAVLGEASPQQRCVAGPFDALILEKFIVTRGQDKR